MTPTTRPATGRGARWLGRALIGVLVLAYPIAIYLAHAQLTAGQLLAGLLALLALRSLLAAAIVRRRVALQSALAMALFVAALLAVWFGEPVRMQWLRLYPMLLDMAVAAVFFGSLWTARPLVERIARVFEPELPPRAQHYTRQVTCFWGVLMTVVALLSLATALFAPLRVWSLFNGGVVYVILGGAFALEYLVRRCLQRRWGMR